MKHGNNRLDLRGMHDTSNNYAFYDTIAHNNVSSSSTSGQIYLDRHNTQQAIPIILLGDTGTVNLTTWGRNNIVSNSQNDNFIYSTISNTSLNYINKNFWAYGAWGSLTAVTINSGNYATYMVNITYPLNNPVCDSSVNVSGGSVYCGVGFDLSQKGSSQTTQSVMELSSKDCLGLYDLAEDYLHSNKYQQAYDTAKKFVEECANVVVISGNKGSIGFGITSSANFARNDDKNRFDEYREWLKSVLYIGTDTSYYCRDVDAIMGTYFNYNSAVGGPDYRAMETILRWVTDSGKCDYYFGDFEVRLKEIRDYWHTIWVDSSLDTTVYPWDTTLTTIDDLDLSILRNQPGSVNPIAAGASSRLGIVTTERNPFTNEIALKVELYLPTMLRLDIYDELGRQVYGEGLGYKPQGEHRFTITSHDWSAGIYYARISTSGGEVRTVKLVKK
jgi:hypothetical protein